jgi:hypothetical protein
LKEEISHEKKVRNLRLFALACCGAGGLTVLQSRVPLGKFAWEFFWLLYIGGMELLIDPFTRKLKIWMRILILLGLVAIVGGSVYGLIQLGKMFNIPDTFLLAGPWILMGILAYLWSLWVTFQDW